MTPDKRGDIGGQEMTAELHNLTASEQLEDALALAGDALAQLCQRPATPANLAQIAALAAKIGALAGGAHSTN